MNQNSNVGNQFTQNTQTFSSQFPHQNSDTHYQGQRPYDFSFSPPNRQNFRSPQNRFNFRSSNQYSYHSFPTRGNFYYQNYRGRRYYNQYVYRNGTRDFPHNQNHNFQFNSYRNSQDARQGSSNGNANERRNDHRQSYPHGNYFSQNPGNDAVQLNEQRLQK
jgi:hypothetical protein